MYEFAGSKSAKLIVTESGKLVARFLQSIACLTRVQIYNKISHVALCFAVFHNTFVQNSANIARGVPGCDCFLLPDPARLHPTGASFITRPGEVSAIQPSLATGATLLPLDLSRGHILPVEIAVHGPGSVTVYMPLDF